MIQSPWYMGYYAIAAILQLSRFFLSIICDHYLLIHKIPLTKSFLNKLWILQYWSNFLATKNVLASIYLLIQSNTGV